MCFCYNTVIRFACKLKFCHYSRQRDLWRRHLYQIKWRLFCFGIWSITSWIFFPIKKWISLKYVLNMSCCQSLTQQLLNRLRELEIRSLSLRLERRPRRLNGESLLLRSSRCAAAVLLSSALLSTPQVCSSRGESRIWSSSTRQLEDQTRGIRFCPNITDWINDGHVQWAQRSTRESHVPRPVSPAVVQPNGEWRFPSHKHVSCRIQVLKARQTGLKVLPFDPPLP